MSKINSFSVVIPIFNESLNIRILYEEIILSLKDSYIYEIIFIDDCSNDKSDEILKNLTSNYNLKIVKNLKNLGQSRSILNGIKSAKYETIITLDGDCQNNPKDIEKLLNFYSSDSEIKLVGGIRKHRKDSFLKKISSKLANLIRGYILKDRCKDTGCSLKIFDKKIFLEFPFFNGIHRFLPALFNGYGYKTKFVDVSHRARKFGKSNYGILGRLVYGVKDIIFVWKIIKKHNKKF